jgi:hypothetical protein
MVIIVIDCSCHCDAYDFETMTEMTIHTWLVASTTLKNISQLGVLFPIYGKIKFMFQTTSQI